MHVEKATRFYRLNLLLLFSSSLDDPFDAICRQIVDIAIKSLRARDRADFQVLIMKENVKRGEGEK